jgi:foldase protein PrsA
MIKAVRLTLALLALAATAALVAGCGGVPGNAVAEVDGQSIEKSEYDHWINVAARSSGQGANVSVPKPPEYTACIAPSARRPRSRPRASRRSPTRS